MQQAPVPVSTPSSSPPVLPAATETGRQFWDIVYELFKQYGVIVLVLMVLCILFWHLIWKVWNAAMKAKDDEIDRISKERDKYQSLVFERLMSSGPPSGEKNKSGKGKE